MAGGRPRRARCACCGRKGNIGSQVIQVQLDPSNNFYCSGTRTGTRESTRRRKCAAMVQAAWSHAAQQNLLFQSAVSEAKEQKDTYKKTILTLNQGEIMSIDDAVQRSKDLHPRLWALCEQLIKAARWSDAYNNEDTVKQRNQIALLVAIFHRAVSRNWVDPVFIPITDWFLTQPLRRVNNFLVSTFGFGYHCKTYDAKLVESLGTETLEKPFSHIEFPEGGLVCWCKDNMQIKIENGMPWKKTTLGYAMTILPNEVDMLHLAFDDVAPEQLQLARIETSDFKLLIGLFCEDLQTYIDYMSHSGNGNGEFDNPTDEALRAGYWFDGGYIYGNGANELKRRNINETRSSERKKVLKDNNIRVVFWDLPSNIAENLVKMSVQCAQASEDTQERQIIMGDLGDIMMEEESRREYMQEAEMYNENGPPVLEADEMEELLNDEGSFSCPYCNKCFNPDDMDAIWNLEREEDRIEMVYRIYYAHTMDCGKYQSKAIMLCGGWHVGLNHLKAKYTSRHT